MPRKKETVAQKAKRKNAQSHAMQQYRIAKGLGTYRVTKPRSAPKSRAFAKTIASGLAGMSPLAPVAGLIGEGAGWLGDKIGTALGLGSYEVKSNSLTAVSEGYGPPGMHSRSGDTVIRHREYITDVVSSATPGGFKLNAYYINPGLLATFPWLAQIASGYEEYEPAGMIFEFKSTSVDALNSTNTALGTVIMATNYNSAAPLFTGKADMENSQYSMSFKPSVSMLHPVECDPTARPLVSMYVRNQAVPSGQDQKTYDMGTFQIASVGMQAASVVIGELWVSYEYKLRKPISGPQSGGSLLTDHYYCTGAVGATPFGTVRTLRANSSIGGTLNGANYQFPVSISSGNFMIVCRWTGGGASIVEPNVTITNGTLLSIWNNGALSQVYSPVGGTTSATLCLTSVISVSALGQNFCTFSISAGGTIPSTSNVDVWVCQINNTILTRPPLPPVIALPGADHDIVLMDESDDETEELIVRRSDHPKGHDFATHEATIERLHDRIKQLQKEEKDNILRVRQAD